MKTEKSVDNIRQHIVQKRNELIWSLCLQQEYSMADVARIFNIAHRSTILRILARRPNGWVSPWVKRRD